MPSSCFAPWKCHELDKLAAQYARAGLSIRRFPHIDAFLREYQQKTFPDLQTP